MIQRRIKVSGHFGELLQGRIGDAGPLALVTLPCPALAVEAWAVPTKGLHGAGQRLLSPGRARKMLQSLGLQLTTGAVLRAQMPAGGGAGASTASLVALARLAGWSGSPQDLARACLGIEGATDPLMFPAPETLLWASRHAVILADLPPLPEFEVIGGFYGPPKRTDPADINFPDIADLVAEWRNAAAAADLPALARLASTSAWRTLRARGAGTDPIASLATDLNALGYVIAHTGAARGLIFSPRTVPPQARAVLRNAGLSGVVQFRAGGQR